MAQLQLLFDDLPVPSRQPPSTDTPLLESIRADIDHDDLPDEDTAVADSPTDSSHAATGAKDSLPPVVPVVDVTDTRESVAQFPRGWGSRGGST